MHNNNNLGLQLLTHCTTYCNHTFTGPSPSLAPPPSPCWPALALHGPVWLASDTAVDFFSSVSLFSLSPKHLYHHRGSLRINSQELLQGTSVTRIKQHSPWQLFRRHQGWQWWRDESRHLRPLSSHSLSPSLVHSAEPFYFTAVEMYLIFSASLPTSLFE